MDISYCQSCEKSGFNIINVKVKCKTCFASGMFYNIQCNKCKGKTNIEIKSMEICKICSGAGFINKNFSEEEKNNL
jgi:DnaJ-class molecular chaperone